MCIRDRLKQSTVHNSDTEADRHQIPRPRNPTSNTIARRKWRRALEDIKARQSGIYSTSDQKEEMSARERVKSILQSDPQPPKTKKKIRPKSDGDAVCIAFST